MPENSLDIDDFEHWVTLASTDPQKFEQLRQDKISELIDKAPSERQQRRLRGLQWRIDQIREQHKDSPMAACLAISGLMWETFDHLAKLLQCHANEGISASTPPILQAEIIPFPVKSKS